MIFFALWERLCERRATVEIKKAIVFQTVFDSVSMLPGITQTDTYK